MRFGACVGLDRVSVLEKYGYDFFELGVSSLLPETLDSEFIPVREKAKSFRIKPEAYNVFIKGELKLTGEEVDFDRVIRYVETAVRRAAALGGKIIVFGSGTARRVPDGFPKEKAYEQLKKFLNMVADNAGKHRITIAIEPLNREETNILNSGS
jgi:D-psicose/D-tagatose/L-ribulose 3-epimerase